ncbi:MAG TPA: hypothetical protein VFA34_12960, partial [Actinomycetota bacterium]|nr:hypothetical protein [Actinomycetota bacterium]
MPPPRHTTTVPPDGNEHSQPLGHRGSRPPRRPEPRDAASGDGAGEGDGDGVAGRLTTLTSAVLSDASPVI